MLLEKHVLASQVAVHRAVQDILLLDRFTGEQRDWKTNWEKCLFFAEAKQQIPSWHVWVHIWAFK